MNLHIERLAGPDALEMLAAEWESLDAQQYPRTPFTSPLWVRLWWKHLRQTGSLKRHEFFAHAVRDGDGRLVAIAPLIKTYVMGGHGLLGLRVIQFFGSAATCDFRGIICHPKQEAEVIQAIVSFFLHCESEWDLFLWNGIRTSEIFHDSSVLKMDRQIPDYLVPLPETWEKFRSGLSRNMKEKVRKIYKALREEHVYEFRVIELLEEIPHALERFFSLHSARARMPGTVRHRDYFLDPSNRAFLIDCARQMAQRGKLRIFELEIGANIVASRIAFVLADQLYLYFSGYDPAWRKQSVMTTLVCECIKWAIANDIKTINLSTGKDLSKLRWKPAEIVFHDAILMAPTLRGRLAFHVFNSVVRRIRLHPVWSKFSEH